MRDSIQVVGLAAIVVLLSGCDSRPPNRPAPAAGSGGATTASTTASTVGAATPAGLVLPAEREAWTTSRIVGTPEPPPPYLAKRLFANLSFARPVAFAQPPGSTRWYVAEQGGTVYSFDQETDADTSTAEVALDLTKQLTSMPAVEPAASFAQLYGLTFDPEYPAKPYAYLCYTITQGPGQPERSDGTRVSRFVVSGSPPRLEPESELVLITYLSGGHNAGCLAFGPDGMLYIATGDATDPTPPDVLRAGQDLSNLLSAILRIDVREATAERPYAVPGDNPFVNLSGARPEIYSYGFRNPWKFSFDRETGDLWVGDVGWELWEMIHKLHAGSNHGWSIYEGPQPVNTDWPRGPTPITPPMIALPHSIAASVTGGYVYRGSRFAELRGAYVFGDWETRRIWGARFPEGKPVEMPDIADASVRIIAFAEDNAGELYLLDYDAGTIHTLERNPRAGESREFPTRLSETGLFSDMFSLTPSPGVLPFEINTPQWMDGATAVRHVALPGDSTVRVYDNRRQIPRSMFSRARWFPENAALARTVMIETTPGDESTARRIETQVLHFDGTDWRGYTYLWNEEQTDAALVGDVGATVPIELKDAGEPGGVRKLNWRLYGRNECIRCHSLWMEGSIAFSPHQLNREVQTEAGTMYQVAYLESRGYMVRAEGERGTRAFEVASLPRLVDPHDEAEPLERRARSYLEANCVHCHRFGAGGTAKIDLRAELPLNETNAINEAPMQGDFGLTDGKVIAPGRPYSSVLLYRMMKTGSGRMPHIGSETVDEGGLRLVHEWIASMGTAVAEADDEAVDAVIDELSAASGSVDADRLVESPSEAMAVSYGLGDESRSDSDRQRVAAVLAGHSSAAVRDLFERFVPESQRVARLGTGFDPRAVLELVGDGERGRAVFHDAQATSCMTCHMVGGAGNSFGPELTKIGAKLSAAEILTSLMAPSLRIDSPYQGKLVTTTDSRALVGFITEQTAESITFATQTGPVTVKTAEVAATIDQPASIMPENLLAGLTAQQAADLVAYLAGLK